MMCEKQPMTNLPVMITTPWEANSVIEIDGGFLTGNNRYRLDKEDETQYSALFP